MKPQVGTTSFSFTTSDNRELEVEATVYFDSEGHAETNDPLISEDDEEIDFDSLLIKDQDDIVKLIYTKALPQDEVYDEYNDVELWND